jgi:hypothetical protein
MNSRASILQGQRPQAGHEPALQNLRSALRAVSINDHFQALSWETSRLSKPRSKADNRSSQEVSRITDQRVEFSLRSADAAAGKWLQEDPPLSTVQRISGSG